MNSTIFIPKKCKVGFNPRSDTYTGMLGYVIYNDGKKWRKEDSWKGWIYNYIDDAEYERLKQIEYYKTVADVLATCANARPYCIKDGKVEVYTGITNNYSGRNWLWVDKNITKAEVEALISYSKFYFNTGKSSKDKKVIPVEFENEPMEGFVLNKKAGGTKYGWNARQTYCRVYDPRGFEFEISIPNLLYILENTNSIKGKGLEGKFVYGWDGKDLVLIPESAPEYKEMVNFTKLQDETVKKSQLIIGGIYIDSSNCKVTYMGDAYQKDWRNNISSAKKLWFATDDDYLTTKDIKSIKRYSGENNDKFATLIDKLEKDSNYYKGKPEYVKLELTEADLLKHFESVSRQYYAYTKVDGDLKKIEIEKPYRYYKGEYTVIIGREKEYFEKSTFDDSPLVNILKKYEIWQLKTTK